MKLQRYEINDEAAFDAHPMMELVIPQSDGGFVMYEDVMKLLEAISNCDPDMSPKDAVIASVIEEPKLVPCPECANIEDEQYTCTFCWCQGGNGTLPPSTRVTEYKE